MDSTQDFSRLKKKFREVIRHWKDDPTMTEWVAERSLLGKWPLPNDIDLMTNKVEIEHYLNLIEERKPVALGEAQEGELQGGESYEQMAERQDQNKEEAEAAQAEAAAKNEQEVLEFKAEAQLVRLLEAAEFAKTTLGRTNDLESAEHALLAWYADTFDEKLRASHAKRIVRKAANELLPGRRKRPFTRDEVVDVAVPTWLVKGLFRNGVPNALVAQAKVGKTMLEFGVIGALARGDEEFLGMRTDPSKRGVNCPPVFIVANDQSLADHVYILQREGLWDGQGVIKNDFGEVVRVKGKPKWPIEAIYDSSVECGLSQEHIEEYVQTAMGLDDSIWIFDCYTSLLGMGTDENDSTFGDAARYLQQAFSRREVNATPIVAHHANASGTGGTGVLAASGHKSFARPFSNITYMNYLVQVPDNQNRTDHRLLISSNGRTGRDAICAEITDDGWHVHGNGAQMAAEEARERTLEALGEGPQAKAYWFILGYSERNQGTMRSEVQGELNKNRQQVADYIKRLIRKGLIYAVSNAVTDTGGSPADLLWVTGYGPQADEFVSSKPRRESNLLSNLSSTDKRGGKPDKPYDLKPVSNGLSALTSSQGEYAREERKPFNKDEWLSQPVEVFEGGEWHNSWKCSYASAHEVHAWKTTSTGKMPQKRKGLIPGKNVRLCQHVPLTQPEPGEPGYDPNAPF